MPIDMGTVEYYNIIISVNATLANLPVLFITCNVHFNCLLIPQNRLNIFMVILYFVFFCAVL